MLRVEHSNASMTLEKLETRTLFATLTLTPPPPPQAIDTGPAEIVINFRTTSPNVGLTNAGGKNGGVVKWDPS